MDKIIYTENDFIRFPSNPIYGPSPFDNAKKKAVAGDIVLWDKQNQSKLIVTLEQFNETYKDDSNFVGIAVVVVPASHTPDGTIRCVVPKYIVYSGGINSPSSTPWGDYKISNYDIESLPNIQSLKYRIHGTTTYSSIMGYYPCPSNAEPWGPTGGYTDQSLDPLAPLYRQTPYSPSPYGEDGISKNPDFFINEQGEFGGLCDEMDGKNNTNIIIHDYSANTAAGYCNNFTSEGIAQGDCYLPAAGEAVYLMVRHAQISNGILAINPEFDPHTTSGFSKANIIIHTSSEFDSGYNWYLTLSNGTLSATGSIGKQSDYGCALGFVAF